MAEDKDESSKTEDPTQKRLDDARKRGQVAQSREVNNTLILLASTLALAGFTPWIADRSRQLFTTSLGEAHLVRVGLGDVQAIATDLVLAIALLSGPVVLAALVAGIAAGIAQVGWMVAPEALKPQFSKISPLKGLSRMLSLSALVEFAKGLLKMALVAWIFWSVVVPAFDSLPLMVLRDVQQSLVEVSALTLKLLFVVVAATVVIAAAERM